MGVVEDEQVGDQMVIFDHLGLFMLQIFTDNAIINKGNPLGKVVEFFAFIRSGIDAFAKLGIIVILKHESSSDSPSQFPESIV